MVAIYTISILHIKHYKYNATDNPHLAFFGITLIYVINFNKRKKMYFSSNVSL